MALAATVMLETGERGSLSQAAYGAHSLESAFNPGDFWLSALPVSLSLIGIFASIPFGHLAERQLHHLVERTRRVERCTRAIGRRVE